MKPDVYVIHCQEYADAPAKLGELLAMMGGMGKYARQGEKITLKANLLGAAAPEQAKSAASTASLLILYSMSPPFFLSVHRTCSINYYVTAMSMAFFLHLQGRSQTRCVWKPRPTHFPQICDLPG